MSNATPWKLGTVVFGLTSVVLGALLLLDRPADFQAAPEEPEARGGDGALGTHDTPREPEARARVDVVADEVAARASAGSTGSREAPIQFESGLDAAIYHFVVIPGRSKYSGRAPEWPPDDVRDELVVVLRDWLSRPDEVAELGVKVDGAAEGYAELEGARALPVLDRVRNDYPHLRRSLVQAYAQIDDRAAMSVLDQMQREWIAEGEPPFRPYFTFMGGRAQAELLESWAFDEGLAASGVPRAARRCLLYLRPDMRERIWGVASADERLALTGELLSGEFGEDDRRLRTTTLERALREGDFEDAWFAYKQLRWPIDADLMTIAEPIFRSFADSTTGSPENRAAAQTIVDEFAARAETQLHRAEIIEKLAPDGANR